MYFSVFSPIEVNRILLLALLQKNDNQYLITIFQVNYTLNYICYEQRLFISLYFPMVSNFTIFLYFSNIYFQVFLYKYNRFNEFPYDSCCFFINNFVPFYLKLIIFIACSFKDSENFFRQLFHLHTSCLLSMILNDDFVYIENLMEYVHLLLL